jgi:hypothetical protein
MHNNEAVNIAYQIIDMHKEILKLREEVIRLKHYEKEYHALLNNNIKDSEKMTDDLVNLLMKPKMVKALGEIQKEDR